MRVRRLEAALLLVLSPCLLYAQRGRGGRGGGGGATATAQPIRGLIVGIHGTVKQITKKSLMLEADDGRLFTLRMSGKTKFVEDDKPIKANEVGVETVVAIEMTEDNDAKLTAVRVIVDPVQPAHVPKTRQQ